MTNLKIMRKLTPWDVVEAFPSECETILAHELCRIKKELKPFFEQIEDIREYPDDVTRTFLTLMVELEMPRDDVKLYNWLLRIKKIYEGRQAHPERERLNVERAKAQPIGDLYDFEKVKIFRKYIMAVCPFHSEKTASFYIYSNSNRFHCFGCGTDGDSIDFIMKLNGLTFVDAVKQLGG